jgi:hypothetical protein
LEDLLQYGLDAFWDSGFYVSLHGLVELFLGQVFLLPHSTCDDSRWWWWSYETV